MSSITRRFDSRSSRRSFLRGAGGIAALTLGSSVSAAALSTNGWELLWELPVEPPQQTPAAYDETAYVPSGSVVRAVEAETGDASWVTSVGEQIAQTGLLATADSLYVGTVSGELSSRDTATGDADWSTSVGAAVEGLVLSGGVLVVQTAATLHGVDVSDGSENWQTPLESDADGDTAVQPVASGTTVVGSSGSAVYGVDRESGGVEWVTRRPGDDLVHSLAVWDESVVVGGAETTELLTLESGEQLWSRPAESRHVMTVAESAIYAMGSDGTDALDPGSGRTTLSLDVTAVETGGLVQSEIEPHGTVVVLSGERDGTPTVLIVDPSTGTVHWELGGDEGGVGFGRAVVVDERLVVQDLERGVTVGYGEPADDATGAAGGGARTTTTTSATGGDSSNGPGLETILAVVGILVTVAGVVVGAIQLRIDWQNAKESNGDGTSVESTAATDPDDSKTE